MKRAVFYFLLLLPVAAADQPGLPFDLRQVKGSPLTITAAAANKDKVKAVQPAPAVVLMGGNIVLLGTIGTPAPAPGPLQPGSAILRWKNGESLQGDIAAASSSSISWKTSLFEDPLQLDWKVLDRIDWTSTTVPATGPFSIALRDGSFLYGDLVSISPDSISIHSTRHGDTILKRSEVLNVRRLHRGNLLYAGPTGNVGWQRDQGCVCPRHHPSADDGTGRRTLHPGLESQRHSRWRATRPGRC